MTQQVVCPELALYAVKGSTTRRDPVTWSQERKIQRSTRLPPGSVACHRTIYYSLLLSCTFPVLFFFYFFLVPLSRSATLFSSLHFCCVILFYIVIHSVCTFSRLIFPFCSPRPVSSLFTFSCVSLPSHIIQHGQAFSNPLPYGLGGAGLRLLRLWNTPDAQSGGG